MPDSPTDSAAGNPAGPAVTIRRATADDNEALAAIDRSSPIVEGSKSIAIDRAPSYWTHRRIMGPAGDGSAGEPLVLLAEVDGRPAGVYCGVMVTSLIDGAPRRLRYLFGARILPEFQGLGLGKTLAGALRQAYADDLGDSMYYFIVRGNEAAEGAVRGAGNRWSVEAVWGRIHTDGLAGDTPDLTDIARRATPADAQRIADIFNAAHAGEQLFTPYTADSLSERLSRVPEVYTFDNVCIGQGAAVGVWEHWNTLREEAGGAAVESKTAMALDYGALPGHEDELAAILRALAAHLGKAGVGRLGLFTTEPSRLFPTLEPLFGSREYLGLWTPGIEEPSASRYGVYLDPVYF